MSRLENIDCDKGMEDLQACSINHIFTDPPYVKDQYYQAYSTLFKHPCLNPGPVTGYPLTLI